MAGGNDDDTIGNLRKRIRDAFERASAYGGGEIDGALDEAEGVLAELKKDAAGNAERLLDAMSVMLDLLTDVASLSESRASAFKAEQKIPRIDALIRAFQSAVKEAVHKT